MKVISKLNSAGGVINPLLELEKWRYVQGDELHREVGFCAEWTLDNLCK